MKAAVLKEYRKIEWTEVPTPEIKDNQVLVKTIYASICGSDQHIFRGDFHPRTKLPLIPGHEFAGIIEETGSEVSNYKKGDLVAVDPIIWCGTCQACLIGHYPACTSLKLAGIDLDGGFGEYVAVNENMLYLLPPGTDPLHGALIEILSIGFHACKRAGLKQNDTAAIWGAGKVGQSILQAARTKTVNTIYIIDPIQDRLDIASKNFENVVPVNPLHVSPVEVIKGATSGKGVDVAFEAVGHFREFPGIFNPVRSCINVIRGAGNVCVLGLGDEPAPVLFKEMIWKEARIVASRVSHGEFAEAIYSLASGSLKPGIMITDVLHSSEAQKGFELLEKEPEKHLKIMLRF